MSHRINQSYTHISANDEYEEVKFCCECGFNTYSLSDFVFHLITSNGYVMKD